MSRHGHSLVEAIVALLAGTVVCAGVAALAATQQRLTDARVPRLGGAETVRIVTTVLRRELASLDPAADVGGAGSDTLSLRLYRGFAVVCSVAAGPRLFVRFRGEREADPTRDSLLPVLPPGSAPVPITASDHSDAPCPGEGELRVWRAEAPSIPGTPLLLFQRGTYSLSSKAFRVRHGAEGRQPLTGEWLDDRGSALLVDRDATGPAAVAVRLRFPGAGLTRALSVRFWNRFSDSPPAGAHP